MLNNTLKILYFILIIIFFYFIFYIYFSKKNISKVEDAYFNFRINIEIQSSDLPLIKNDTDNIINYNSEKIIQKKIKKRKIWELLE